MYQGGDYDRPEIVIFINHLSSILTSCPFTGQVYFHRVQFPHPDLIVHIFTDNLKEATGQGDRKGVLKEGRDDEEAGTVERDTSQPEAVSTLGEKTVVVIDREAGFSDSHQVRPLHLSIFV